MRKLVWLLVFLVSASYGETLKTINKDISAIINKYDKHINVGIEVRDISRNRVIFARNANRYYVPASSLKLFADAAALIYLGPDFHFRTSIATDATMINNGRLEGNLYLEFSGAPDLSTKQLAELVNALKSLGIYRISKDVILVGANYTDKAHGPGWMLEDIQLGYGAPISPFFLDRNITTLHINPASHPEQNALIDMIDASGKIALINKVKTVKDPKLCDLNYQMDKTNRLTVSGCVGIGSVAKEEEVAILNPALYTQNVVQKVFIEESIVVEGTFKQGRKASDTKILTAVYSKALDDILKDTLKPSNNAFADSVFLKIGEQFYKSRATWKNAQRAVKYIIQRYAGVDVKRAGIYDGSGLSRYNLVTPHQMAGLLVYLYQAFPISHEFISALPIAGRDGTLRRRFLVSEQVGRVRAKTGSMRGVVSLAGFLPSKNQHILAFSMLINGIPGNSRKSLYRYRVLEDKLCNYLLQTNLDNAWSKRPKKAYPFLRKKSFAQHEKQKEHKMVNVEWALRKALKGESVNIIRRADSIELKGNYSKRDTTRLKRIANILAKRQLWAYIQSQNLEFDALLRRQFKKANYLLKNEKNLPEGEYVFRIYGLGTKTQ